MQESGADAPAQPQDGPGSTDPWAVLASLADRARYLRPLAPAPDPATGVARDAHHLLVPPARMTRSATNFPDPGHVRRYVDSSCDLTVQGGTATAVASAAAVCALAGQFVLRRVGGSSAGAPVAAAAAAAELGRGAPDPPPEPGRGLLADAPDGPDAGGARASSVVPGFAGLAQLTAWLAGQDGDRHRIARLLQPGPGTRAAFRVLVAVTGPRDLQPRGRRAALAAAALGAVGGATRAVVALLWLGALVGWAGLVAALARAAVLPSWGLALAAVPLLVTFALAAAAGTALCAAGSLRRLVASTAQEHGFGLVPGVRPVGADLTGGAAGAGRRTGRRRERWADRLAGMPDPGQVPPLTEWVADRLDDLAGVPRSAGGPQEGDGAGHAGQARYALTFGDLWLGRLGRRTPADLDVLRRAADDPRQRVVDLQLSTTDVSQGRPLTVPFRAAEHAEREGGSPWLFCHDCLAEALPLRVVEQMILLSPAQATEAGCPRHPGQTLHELPEPWDLPVVTAVRLSCAPPGLMSAVALHTLEAERRGPRHDGYGRRLAPAPDPGADLLVARTHWFADGGLTTGFAVDRFDTLLPRWPTFALGVERVPDRGAGSTQLLGPPDDDLGFLADTPGGGPHGEWLRVPEQDAQPQPRSWRRIGDVPSFAAALVAGGTGWRDRLQADLPGLRGRVALVRTGPGEQGPFLSGDAVLRLALRGYHAGETLRRRFTGPDGEVPRQTQLDRYRWVRLRRAMRRYRSLSLDIGARLPLYSDLAASYRVPAALTSWFTPPVAPGSTDPAWPDAAAAVTHLRALSAGGVLDWDTDYGAPPAEPEVAVTREE